MRRLTEIHNEAEQIKAGAHELSDESDPQLYSAVRTLARSVANLADLVAELAAKMAERGGV